MMNKLAAALLVAVAACASEPTDTFELTGQLDDASTVSHVIATNVDTGERVVIDLKNDGERDGRFRVVLPTGDGAWIVTFVDASQVGAAMRVATLQSQGIDAFSSPAGGVIDFGRVHFDGRFAHGATTWETLESVLGLSASEIHARGEADDLTLRYANPDIDGNGTLDAVEGRSFVLDLVGTYRMVDGQTQYAGTAIEAGVPHDMGMHMATASVRFDAPFYPFGAATGIDAGTSIGAPHIKLGELDGTNLVGLVAAGDHDLPRGAYTFGFDNGTLTFADVDVPSAATLAANLPLLQVRPADAACTGDCAIDAITIAWPGAPRDAKIDLVALFGDRRISLSANLTDGESSIPWQAMPVAGAGITRSELAYITSSRICYASVSYTSELGIKMTGQLHNPSCF